MSDPFLHEPSVAKRSRLEEGIARVEGKEEGEDLREVEGPVGKAGARDDHWLLELAVELRGELVVDERSLREAHRRAVSWCLAVVRVDGVENPEEAKEDRKSVV